MPPLCLLQGDSTLLRVVPSVERPAVRPIQAHVVELLLLAGADVNEPDAVSQPNPCSIHSIVF